MLFIKLINSSMKRNRQIYAPYLTASSMLVSINYIFLAIAANNSLKHLNTGAATTALLKLGAEFILFVTIAFLIYVNRFLWQQRYQEMGLYSMLGMTKSNLQRLIIIEKGYLLAGSLLTGLIIGIIFEKLAFLSLSYLLQIDRLTQPWVVPSAIWQTMLIFCGYFAILVLIDIIKIKHFTPTELWQETTDPNKHLGRMFKISGLIGFLCLLFNRHNQTQNFCNFNFHARSTVFSNWFLSRLYCWQYNLPPLLTKSTAFLLSATSLYCNFRDVTTYEAKWY